MGKCALITGGTKGIGKAIAVCLAETGYDLILTYSGDHTAAVSAQGELSAFGVNIYLQQADISKKESIDKIYTCLKDNSCRLDALVFNAGITCRDSFETISLEAWKEVFFANVHFPVFLLQRILPFLQKGSSVVFTGSSMGIYPHSVSLVYGVTKTSIHALVKNLVKFLSPYEIRVNAVAPGFVDTEWQKNKPVEIRRSIESKIALGRFCEPEEVAQVYKMLIENGYFNGEVISIDGGYSYK